MKTKTLVINVTPDGLGYEKTWKLGGMVHRLDGPAFIDYDGDSHWYEGGLYIGIEWGKK